MIDIEAEGVPDRQLARYQVSALFHVDGRGRLTSVNDVGDPTPPRCFLSRSVAGADYWTDTAPSPELLEALEEWRTTALSEPGPALLAPPPRIARVVYGEHSPTVYLGPAYRFPASLPNLPVPPGIELRLCPPEASNAFTGDFPLLATSLTRRRPVVAAFDGDRPVSVCCAARTTQRVQEAGVDTLPTYRGRGLAPVVVSAWARQVREHGIIPLYSTSWDNRSSLSVATTLGLVPYATTASFYA